MWSMQVLGIKPLRYSTRENLEYLAREARFGGIDLRARLSSGLIRIGLRAVFIRCLELANSSPIDLLDRVIDSIRTELQELVY